MSARTSIHADPAIYQELKELADHEQRSVVDEIRFLVKARRARLGLKEMEAAV